MKTKFFLLLEPVIVAVGFLVPVSAFSHANLIQNSTLKPRDNAAPAANKTPAGVTTTYDPVSRAANPGDTCGQNPSTGTLQTRTVNQPVTALKRGQALTVNWVETIKHTGWFQVWFSPNGTDTGWVLLKDFITHDDMTPAPENYSTSVTVPSTDCSSCAIRVIQVMQDGHPNAPTYYYSCANVTITADGLPPSGGGTTTGGSGSTSGGSSGTTNPDCP